MNHIILLTFYSLQIFFRFSKVCATSISQSKCDDYQKMWTPISETSNGSDENAASKVFPFMVHIYDDDGAYSNGILISENFVLTIANNGNAKYVILGHHSTHTDDAHRQSFEVLKEIQHSDFNIHPNHTIKLLMLEKSVQFSAYIRPACLTRSKSNVPERLIEICWNGISSKTLQTVKLSSILSTKCLAEAATGEQYIRRIDDRTHICAIVMEGEQDVCLGFHGAALLNDDGTGPHSNKIVGIASMNSVCGKHSHIFVQLSEYISWIEYIVWPSNELSESDHAEKKQKRGRRDNDDDVLEIEFKVEKSDPPNAFATMLTDSLTSTSVKPGLNSLMTEKQAINKTTKAPHLFPKSSDENRIKKVVIIFMLVIVLILLIVCGILALCVRKYRAKNRRSIEV